MSKDTNAAAVAVSMTPDAMRAEADQLKASAREQGRAAFDADRRAAQLAYEAGLLEAVANVAAELAGVRMRLTRLQDAVPPAVAAVRAAEDRVRAEEKALVRARSDQAKARADLAPGQRQEELAVRVHAREQVVSDVRVPLAAVQRALKDAERERDDCQREVDVLEAEDAQARRAAENPGTAPDARRLAPGVAGLADMDDETRGLLTVAVLAMAASSGSGSGTAPDTSLRNRDPRLTVAQQDPAKFRYLRTGRSTIAIPAVRP